MALDDRTRTWWRSVLGVLAIVVTVSGSVASTSVTVAGAAAGPSTELTAAQKRDLVKVVRAYDRADRTVIEAFEPAVVVPRMKRWHAAQVDHQRTLTTLVAALPVGACRTAVEALAAVEVSRNEVRLALIRDYKRQDLGLVNGDVVAYAKTVLDRLQAEGGVEQACGVSPVEPASATATAPALTPAQRELMTAVQEAHAVTSRRYDAVFTLGEFVRDVQAIQTSDAAVTGQLTVLVGALPDGPCRTALDDLLTIESRQATIRQSVITAGQAGNLLAVFEAMDQYSKVNTTSGAFVAARAVVVEACGVRL